MKQVAILGMVLLLAAYSAGCACLSPGCGMNGGRVYEGSCCETIAPYSCGPSSCGGMGVDYVDGGPGAGLANCGSYNACGMNMGCYGGGCGMGCLSAVGNVVHVVGDGVLTIAASPFVLVGHLFANCGSRGGYGGCGGLSNGCGCSNEVYYGDNCYQPHDFCDPCMGESCGCGTGCSVSGYSVGGSYMGGYSGGTTTPTGCTRCAGGFSEGIQFGATNQPVQMNKTVPTKPVSNTSFTTNRNTNANQYATRHVSPTGNRVPNRNIQQVSHSVPYYQPVRNPGIQPAQPIQPPQTRIATTEN